MTYEQVIEQFLKEIRNLKAKHLTYRQPGDGSDGTCDCIGLIIGAIRRMGYKWSGIHGSNWAARKEIQQLCVITGTGQLQVGDIVFKAYEKGESKWTLNKYPRYLPGGAYYNGDMKDYYHVGVVTSVSPLNITHMTSPTVKVDTSLGKWRYFGKLNILLKASGSSAPSSGIGEAAYYIPEKKDTIPKTGAIAVVTAKSGKYVKMRKEPSTSCRMYEEVPVGSKVTLLKPGEKWAQISYGKRNGWYMMAEFLDIA